MKECHFIHLAVCPPHGESCECFIKSVMISQLVTLSFIVDIYMMEYHAKLLVISVIFSKIYKEAKLLLK